MKHVFGFPQLVALLVIGSLIWAGLGTGGNTLKIGVIAPLSGSTAVYGLAMRNGLNLAATAINAAGGIGGRTVELVYLDESNDKLVAAEATRELIYRQNVALVIGAVSSDATMNVQRICERARVPLLTSVSTNPFITRVGFRYTFRCLSDDTVQAESLARTAVRRLNLRRVAIIHDSNKYGSMGARVYAEKAAALGQAIPVSVAFDSGMTNFSPLLESIRQQNPDGLLVWGLARESALIVRQARELGMRMPILGGDGMATTGFLDLAGPAAEGALVTMPFNPTRGGEVTRRFLEDYQRAYGTEADSFAAHGYDALQLAATAFRTAGERGIPVREALAGISAYQGVTGPGGLDATGNETRPVELSVVKAGRFVPTES
ncbi:MAG TPA: ABC transporter substrate-binding protein [Candidatus Ozemobacteraceae bacterium]|nr:ABC transporter substrate-binding protein [Candidatus Ozemobacteraceae bacterium]